MLAKLFKPNIKYIRTKSNKNQHYIPPPNPKYDMTDYAQCMTQIAINTNIPIYQRTELQKEYEKNWPKYNIYPHEFEKFKYKCDMAMRNYPPKTNGNMISPYKKKNDDDMAMRNYPPKTNDNTLSPYKKKNDDELEHMIKTKTTGDVQKTLLHYNEKLQSLSKEEKTKRIEWINYILKLPTNYKKPDSDLVTMRLKLDSKIYKMDHAKDDLLSAIHAYNNNDKNNNTIALFGSPGVGKTALVRHLADCVDLPFAHISVGNVNDSKYLVGSSYVYQHSEPGYLVKSIIRMGFKNGIILLDEIDKISNSSGGSEILGLMMHLCDPTQNSVFEDKYLGGVPIDFSNYIFVYSLNNMDIMNPALLSRIGQNIIKIKDYTLDDKIEIVKMHVLPDLVKGGEVVVSDDVIKYVVSECIPFKSKGMRELKAQMMKIVRMVKYYNALGKDGYEYPVVLNEDIVKYVLDKEAKNDGKVGRYIL